MTVVLKGANTVIAAPDGRALTAPFEVPALGTGGSGDVLAGVIASLLGQGLGPFEAAALGVYLHARAGEDVSSHLGDAGLMATDLLPAIPRVRRHLTALREREPWRPARLRRSRRAGMTDRRGAWLEIDLDAIRHNLGLIRSVVGEAALGPVVKAEAYGHGMVTVGRAIEPIVDALCVATLDEAITLRVGGRHAHHHALSGATRGCARGAPIRPRAARDGLDRPRRHPCRRQ